MTKQEAAIQVASQLHQTNPELGITAESAEVIINALVDTIKGTVASGKTLYIRRFGSFGPKDRATKTARNITAGTSVVVPAHTVPAFKPAPGFIELVRTSRAQAKKEAGEKGNDLPF